MKKLFCLILVLLVLLNCLTACNFTKSVAGALEEEAESTPKVEEMMTALAENRTVEAKALMHPQSVQTSDAAIAQMSAYLSGRKVSAMELGNINITTSTGTSGKSRQEQIAYRVILSDGEIIYLNAVYLSDNDGTGFVSFQLVLGVV